MAADINVTSLVDVAFTLLVIFIITAPILQGGVEVNLPQANVRPVSAMDDIFIVSILPDGTIFVEDTALTIEEFEASFPQLVQAAGTQQVYVRGDAAATWGIGLRVIAAASAAGVAVAAMADPRPAARP
jgi:biopolymer transport protein ExbD/biopolymer transport protein TolR